jgi:hypothetical protein
MRTAKNGNGRGNGQSETSTTLINLPDGRSLPLEVVNLPKGGRNGHTKLPPAAQSLTQETQFEVLPDGTLVDLVRERSGDLGFVVCRDGTPTFHSAFQNGDVTLIPPKVHRSYVDAVRLPKMLGARETPRILLSEIDDVLCTYLDLDTSHRKLVGYFALCTWLADLQLVAPYLWIVGPFSGGKSSLVGLLSAICRRSVVAGEMSAAALYTLNTSLRPTLLLDEFEPAADAQSRSLQRLLRNGSRQGQWIFRGPRAYDVFGPKAIASRQGARDAALASRGPVVAMRPTGRELPVLDPDVLEGIADRLQPKLLTFRLENYARVKPVVLASSCLTPRMRDIARALALPLFGDPELERDLLEIIKAHDAQAMVDRHGEPEWIVMTALLRIIHRRGAGSALLTVNKLTSAVEFQLAQAGESYHLKPRKVGEILRSLGFPTQGLGCLGRGLRISKNLVRSIHITAKNLGICRADTLLPEDKDGCFGGTFEECEKDGFGGLVGTARRPASCWITLEAFALPRAHSRWNGRSLDTEATP